MENGLKLGNLHKLLPEEILKLEHLETKRKLLDKEVENLKLNEKLVSMEMSSRVGEDVSTWNFDLKNGVMFETPKQQELEEETEKEE